MSQVLIVDDEESICWGLERLLTDSGHRVSIASSAEEALRVAGSARPDAIVLDVRLPGMDGLEAMQQLGTLVPGAPIVVITAFGSLDVAVAAMRNGAFDYLPKPFDLEAAAAIIDRALAHSNVQSASSARDDAAPQEEFLAASPAMQEVFKRIALVAPSHASVLITGESGTGKELVARGIHRHSRLADRPFVPIHLASLSPTLVESELFGHVRGAFTGADAPRQGLLELANDATVFFDEAADIPPSVQVKLLRVLEQHEVTPVGSAQPRPTSFRVIAATSRSLRSADAPLRDDLYFRLAAFEVCVPPLRERAEDIPLLAEHFLARSRSAGEEQAGFTREAMAELCRRAWPGNVRQLRHAVEHGALLARGGAIAVEHLPREIETSAESSPGSELDAAVRAWARQNLNDRSLHGRLHERFLAQAERPLFETVLGDTFQNRAAAADVLGIHRATLRKKLKERPEPS